MQLAKAPTISNTCSLSLSMSTQSQVTAYLDSPPEPKRTDMQTLHTLILQIAPEVQLWFLDGKDASGKTVSNPNIGYGFHTMTYADGTTKDFYQVGISANKSGISVYIFGTPEKDFLSKTYGDRIGKASVTGYCIKFKALKDINQNVLEEAIGHALLSNIT